MHSLITNSGMASLLEVGCMAHARRNFYELRANRRSLIAEQVLSHFGKLYEVEREVQASALGCVDIQVMQTMEPTRLMNEVNRSASFS
ncbi:hypothetical protein HNP55_004799 [Paucibacter oligotrophus]|uniref:Transposase IS66 central domain-containing protein n=1 Tax=Roseateles oligotrophus TaxID=1769250 RepID=A0A840LC97_9BURK|nr:hypothetical protein [Roseateles oligotrophus]